MEEVKGDFFYVSYWYNFEHLIAALKHLIKYKSLWNWLRELLYRLIEQE